MLIFTLLIEPFEIFGLIYQYPVAPPDNAAAKALSVFKNHPA